ncbi:MAG: hypothetical protein K6F00_10070 [Lachnospiraceae bacterium]|nr:hypothetical protein [Lachnospiraceae bacterium]
MNKKRIFFLLILTVILGILWGGSALYSDLGIIYLGIGAWRVLNVGLGAGFVAALIGTGGVTVFEFGKQRKLNEIEAKRQASIEQSMSEGVEKEGFLSASKRLNEATIRDELAGSLNEGWTPLKKDIDVLIGQSNEMDNYQYKLSELLKKNDAKKLDDAAEVLDKAEQRMLKNIRNVLNYIEVGDPAKVNDRDKVSETMTECLTKNEDILNNTKAFMFSLTDYLNSQGNDDGNEMEMLLNYKDILIQSTKK